MSLTLALDIGPFTVVGRVPKRGPHVVSIDVYATQKPTKKPALPGKVRFDAKGLNDGDDDE